MMAGWDGMGERRRWRRKLGGDGEMRWRGTSHRYTIVK
jgi:hypothetical protein